VTFFLKRTYLLLTNSCCIVLVASSIQPIDKQTVLEGDSLTLSCNASGIPPPMVTWLKVGSSDMSTNGRELMFTNINRKEVGEYRCEASNECGNATDTATIEVQCKFNVLKILLQQNFRTLFYCMYSENFRQ